MHEPTADADCNAYERERDARIAANRARMSALGLAWSSTSSMSSSMLPPGSSNASSAWAKAVFGAPNQRPKVKRRPMVLILVSCRW